MANIERFDLDDYESGQAEKIDALTSEYLKFDLELGSLIRELSNDPNFTWDLAAPDKALIGAGTGAAVGTKLFPGLGTLAGGFIGGLGGLIWDGVELISGIGKNKARQRIALNQLQGLRTKVKTAYTSLRQKFDIRAQRFQTLSKIGDTQKRLRRTQAQKAKAALSQNLLNARLNYQRDLTNLNRRTALTSVRLDNTIRNYKNSKQLFFVSKDALYEKYKIEKSSIDTQLNVLTSKYYLADLAKDVQSVGLAKARQQQFMQTIIPVSQGLKASYTNAQASLTSLKQISQSIETASAIEQSEAEILLNYKQTTESLRGKETILRARGATLGQAYKVDLKTMTAKAAKGLGELDGQRRAYNVELEGLALQKQVLHTSYDERSQDYSGRMALIDEELSATIDLIDLGIQQDASQEAYNLANMFEQTRQLIQSGLTTARNILASDDLSDIQAQAQSFDSIFKNTINTINQALPKYNVDYEKNKTLTSGSQS